MNLEKNVLIAKLVTLRLWNIQNRFVVHFCRKRKNNSTRKSDYFYSSFS